MKRAPALSLFLACLLAPALALAAETRGPSIWLPETVSARGRDIDALYMHILYIVIIIFVITQGLLLYSVIAFRARPGRKARFFHGSTGVELVLAVVPAVILLYITVASVGLWGLVRLHGPGKDAVHVQVLAEQFSWNFRYPGPDGVFGTSDDVMSSGEMAVPVGREVVLHIASKDVIHSLFLPEARLKQDLLPGLLGRVWSEWDVIPVWDLKTQKRVLLTADEYAAAPVALSGYKFSSEPNPVKAGWYQASESAKINYLRYHYDRDPDAKLLVVRGGRPVNEAPLYVQHYFEIACAQLCGNLHFGMRGTLRVLPEPEYEAWLKAQAHDDFLASKWSDVWDKYHPEYNRAL
jgi:cytochrome c oxidase subunit 2